MGKGSSDLLDLILDGHDLVQRHRLTALQTAPTLLLLLLLTYDSALLTAGPLTTEGRVERAHLCGVLTALTAAREELEVAEVGLAVGSGVQGTNCGGGKGCVIVGQTNVPTLFLLFLS